MVGTSKILTVSYGTFSCTLEGFDDSFNTMKAIAEYFRDLAADDRYFGAEPPTPDAEMLARIAEKEIARRVEARMDESGIVLRPALAQGAAAMPADPVPAAGDTSSAAIAAAAAAVAASPAVEEDTPQQDIPVIEDEETSSDEDTQTEFSSDPAETAEEADPVGDDGDAGSEAPEEQSSTVLAAEDPAPIAEDNADSATDEEETPAPVMTGAEVPAHPDADSVAAKLQRIRAVVGAGAATPLSGDENNDFSEDLTEAFFDDDTPDVADIAAPAEEASVEPAEEEETAAEDAPENDDMISRIMARHTPADEAEESAEDATQDEAISDADEVDDAEAEVEVEAEAPVAPRVVRIKRADLEAATPEADEAEEDDFDEDDIQGPDLGMLDGADELDAYLSDDDDGALSPEEEAEMMEVLGDWDADDADDEADTAIEEVTVEDAIEEAEIVEDSDQAADETSVDEDEPRRARPGRAIFDSHPDEDEDGMNRLLNEADAQMQEPEGNRRRAAIEQLKAAVAANEAARQAGDPDVDDGKVENAFRDDLSQVVRPRRAPRRADDGHQRTERPRPAPLKLVASQRVDLDQSEERRPVTPVRPRRVARPEDAAQNADQAGGSFADFAEQMGATELPDLLEAAAAYTAFVEGADAFSRPQIMRRVRAVVADDFNREDGLRSFADLLRQGRFTKISNGRFQVAQDTRFHPERQAS